MAGNGTLYGSEHFPSEAMNDWRMVHVLVSFFPQRAYMLK